MPRRPDLHVVRATIVGEDKPLDIIVRDGIVAGIGPASRIKADIGSTRAILAPTLFDIQVNGVAGIDLQCRSLVPQDLRRITEFLAGWGVSRWVPTLITGPLKDMEHGCRVTAEAMQYPLIKKAVPGIHLEGPYLSPLDGPRGAHPQKYVRNPDIREFDRLLNAADGNILYTTVAPELSGAIPYIRALVSRGVMVSLGHHNAAADQIAQAVDAGARLCTHLGNGLATTLHRHHNPLWPQLAEDRLTASLIADLEHLPAAALKTFVRAKGPERIILTSDCVHIAGLKPGKYALAGAAVELKRSGRICLSGTELLAGSSLMLLQGVLHAFQFADMTLAQAFAGATTIPARLLGLPRTSFPPRVGRRADFIVLDIDKSQLRWRAAVHAVFINGARVTPRPIASRPGSW